MTRAKQKTARDRHLERLVLSAAVESAERAIVDCVMGAEFWSLSLQAQWDSIREKCSGLAKARQALAEAKS